MVQVAASITSADFGNLHHVVRNLERAGVDRLHLDVMDGHFVPNITFGPDVVAAVRRLSRLPIDVHLMISDPAQYLDRFIDAGSDTITFHVEVEGDVQAKSDVLERIRAAGRGPGLAISPGTPMSATADFAAQLDIMMVMTVEPGFGGQHFMAEQAPKIAQARLMFAGRPGTTVHVDGGVNADTADVVGHYGADVAIVGSALFQRGLDTAQVVDAVKRNAAAATVAAVAAAAAATAATAAPTS